jgi:hypothetical protein
VTATMKQPAPSWRDDPELAALIDDETFFADLVARTQKLVDVRNAEEDVKREKAAQEALAKISAAREAAGARPPIQPKNAEHLQSVESNGATVDFLRGEIIAELTKPTNLPAFAKIAMVDDLITAAFGLGAMIGDSRDRRELELSMKQSADAKASLQKRQANAATWQAQAEKEAQRLLDERERPMTQIYLAVHKAIEPQAAGKKIGPDAVLEHLRKWNRGRKKN